MLLPYAEQADLQDLIDFSSPIYTGRYGTTSIHPNNEAAARTLVPMFRCPSDGREDLFTQFDCDTAAGQAYRGTNVVASTGSGRGTARDPREKNDGLFYDGSQAGFRDILDGTSHTVVFSETLLGDGTIARTRPVQDYDAVAWVGHGSVMNPDVESLSRGPVWGWFGYRGYAWISGKAYASTFNTYDPPNTNHPDACQLAYGWFSARSHHSGGVDVSLADGSVRFVTESVDQEIRRNAGSIADRNISEGL